jgi:hypothetical protein
MGTADNTRAKSDCSALPRLDELYFGGDVCVSWTKVQIVRDAVVRDEPLEFRLTLCE